MASEQAQLVFIGSHLGYPMDRTPLGGGAMVGIQLAREWARGAGVRLTLIGSGSHAPAQGATYIQLPAWMNGKSPDLVRFSELEYARFCRQFEAATTEYLERNWSALNPRRTVIAVNDISESPDLARISRLGYRLVSIWHVDVVEFFNRIYLGGLLAPERLTRTFTRMDRAGAARLLPNVLRLVFQKQQDAVRYSDRMVLPSRQMAQTIGRCYAHLDHANGDIDRRTLVIPWGCWPEALSDADIRVESDRLRAHYQIGPRTRVLMTLSRISPEKGIDVLLKALSMLERSQELSDSDLCLFICGEPAFMQGEAYGRKVRRCARRLKRSRIFFPGYLSSFDKQAYFRLADLFVSPSIHESYGLTLVEAMRAGLPILASDHYGVDEILNPTFGCKVSYRSSNGPALSLAEGLRRMLIYEDLRDMGKKAQAAAAGMVFPAAAQRLLQAALELL